MDRRQSVEIGQLSGANVAVNSLYIQSDVEGRVCHGPVSPHNVYLRHQATTTSLTD